MSNKLILVWGADKDLVLARSQQLIDGLDKPKVFRRDIFDVVLAEDMDRRRSVTSQGAAFAVVVQVEE